MITDYILIQTYLDDHLINDLLLPDTKENREYVTVTVANTENAPHPLLKVRISDLTVTASQMIQPFNPMPLSKII